MVGILILGFVVLGLYLRSLNPEQRVQFLRKIVNQARAAVSSARQQIGKVPPGCETFAETLRARTNFPVVIPAILALNIAIFLGMCFGDGALGEPATLLAWGGSVGPRTTNGEWWRLVTSLFVHAGMFQLLGSVIGLVSVGLMLERLVGSVALAVTYTVAGLIAGAAQLSAHQTAVNAGASGAIFGVYGLLIASVLWGFHRPSSATIPVAAIKGLIPGALVFLVLDVATSGLRSDARIAGFAAGFLAGLILAAGITYRKPAMRQVLATVTATAAIVVVMVAPLRGLDDVRAAIADVISVEDRTSHEYDAILQQSSEGRSTMSDRIELIDQIRPRLQALRVRLESFHKVPREHQALVASALEYLKARDESWRLRKEALRRSNLQILGQADAVERTSLDTFRKLKVVVES